MAKAPLLSGRFRSLRFRLLLPLAAASLLSALAVAMASYWQGDRWARAEIADRYASIAQTLSGASYPLNQQVVDSLAALTDTELLTLRQNGSIATTSLTIQPSQIAKAIAAHDLIAAQDLIAAHDSIAAHDLIAAQDATTDSVVDDSLRIGNQNYYYGVFRRGGPAASSDDVSHVVVLFDESKRRDAKMRAAAWPLATGLSTVFLLTAVALFLTQRLIGRLSRLSVQVDRIAEGQFDTDIDAGTNDEVASLGQGVRRMSHQLQQMWDSLQRTQGEKLLHQIAGGLAHQLRNSLTGARMAVELHSGKCETSNDESLKVALVQLEQTDDAVRRLLLVAAGKQDDDRPTELTTAIDDVRTTIASTAKHLQVDVQWKISDELERWHVTDGPSLSAAVSNLVLNAIEVAREVIVTATRNEQEAIIQVIDNGPGPANEIEAELFEPFVTSKPEGLGLGLPLVKRSAQRLGGSIQWQRDCNKTIFQLNVHLTPPSN